MEVKKCASVCKFCNLVYSFTVKVEYKVMYINGLRALTKTCNAKYIFK